MTEPIKLSANKLNMWLGCPLKLHMYLERYPTGPVDTKYIDLGNAVHHFIEGRMGNETKDAWDYFKEEGVLDEFKEDFADCIKTAEPYLALAGKAIPEKTIHKIFDTPKGRRIDLEARIDLICDDTIYDWKTSKDIDKPEYRLQGQVYHFATDFIYPNVKFVKMRDGKILEIPAPPKDYIPKLCDTYCDCLESGDFRRKQTRLCEYCDYKAYCTGDLQYVYIGDVKADPEKYGMVKKEWKK